MYASTLIRWSGLAAVVAGVLFLIVELLELLAIDLENLGAQATMGIFFVGRVIPAHHGAVIAEIGWALLLPVGGCGRPGAGRLPRGIPGYGAGLRSAWSPASGRRCGQDRPRGPRAARPRGFAR